MGKRITLTLAIGLACFALASEANAFGGYPRANNPAPPQPLFITDAIKATGWASNTFMYGEELDRVKNTDILYRPNRHLHFYGNTVRYFHYKSLANGAALTCSDSDPIELVFAVFRVNCSVGFDLQYDSRLT